MRRIRAKSLESARGLPVVRLGSAADETPAVGVEVPEPFLDLEKCACVSHCGIDLHRLRMISGSDARSGFSLGVARDFLGIEFVERARYPSRFFSTSDQFKPACAPESTRPRNACGRYEWGHPISRS